MGLDPESADDEEERTMREHDVDTLAQALLPVSTQLADTTARLALEEERSARFAETIVRHRQMVDQQVARRDEYEAIANDAIAALKRRSK